METQAKPQLEPLEVGTEFKILKVTADAGAEMPLHYCTSEAVVTVQQGATILELGDQTVELSRGSVFLIPAGKEHSLKVNEPLKSTVVMASGAEIKFVDR